MMNSVLDDDFIDTVITPETETENPDTRMISREFYGMEAVAQFDEKEDYHSEEGEK